MVGWSLVWVLVANDVKVIYDVTKVASTPGFPHETSYYLLVQVVLQSPQLILSEHQQ